MASDRFTKLQLQIKLLAKALLPRDLSKPVIRNLRKTGLRALSFRVLSHAEIESYIEDRALEVVAAVDAAWKERSHVSRSTFSILAFSGSHLDALPHSLSPPPKKKQSDWEKLLTPDKRLSEAISKFYHTTKNDNHGVREKNIISLLIPIGIAPDRLDPLLITELNNFSARRGEAAHSTTLGHVTQAINPRDEYDQVSRIISGLIQWDYEIDTLLRDAT